MKILNKKEAREYKKTNVLNKHESKISNLMRKIPLLNVGESLLLNEKDLLRYIPDKLNRGSETVGSYISTRLNNKTSYLKLHKMGVTCRTLTKGGVMIIRIK